MKHLGNLEHLEKIFLQEMFRNEFEANLKDVVEQIVCSLSSQGLPVLALPKSPRKLLAALPTPVTN